MNPPADLTDLLSLRGKVALVTGGSGGLGSAIVRLLLRAGAEVISMDRPGLPAAEGARSLPCDLADRDAIVAQLAEFRRLCPRLHILVHCAGITRDALLWKMEDEDWSDVMRVNLDAAFHLLKRAVPIMRESGEGAVVLISSINGERGKLGQANYAASKAGLLGLGRTAARELGRFGIRVNVVAPGMILTGMTEKLSEEVRARAAEESVLGRLGTPEDVARAVLFLASPLARHVTGQVLRVDGGQLIA
jgi:acetoacetyl-CoA reductase/3-oxoacyl-[acyl-carrier protein] reductase